MPPKAAPSIKKSAPANWWKWLVLLFPILLYSNTLSHDYTLDDHFVIRGNWMVEEGVEGIPDLLTTDYWEGPLGDNKVSKLYRPLSLVTFAIEKSLWGFQPGTSHFINVLFYAFACFFLYLFLVSFFHTFPPWVPLVIVLLFAAHPLHTESVANLKGRAELMAAFFLFASLYYMLKGIRGRKTVPLLASILLFFLGLLSKEDAITFLAVIPLVLWFELKGADLKKRIAGISLKTLPFAAMAGVMLILRSRFADDPDKSFSYIENPLERMQGMEYFANTMMVSGQYLLQILFPVNLMHDYSYNQIPLAEGFGNPMAIFGLLALLAILVFGILHTLKFRYTGFAFLFFIITFSVASNLFVTIGVMKAERMMFMPLLGIMMALVLGVYALSQKYSRQTWLPYLAGGFILLYAAFTYNRNPDWKDNETLLAADIDKAERNVKVKANYAALVRNRAAKATSPRREQLLAESARHLWESTLIAPDYNRPWIDLGYLFEMRGMTDSAVVVFSEALKLNPTDQNLVQRIANLKVLTDPAFLKGKQFVDNDVYAPAIPIFDSLVKVYPSNFEVWFYLGGVNFNSGRFPQALEAWERAKQINPADPRIDEPLGHARNAVRDAS